MIEQGALKCGGKGKKEKRKKGKKGGNGFFHFKSHFVQSQMTVFKDALSFSPQDFGQQCQV